MTTEPTTTEPIEVVPGQMALFDENGESTGPLTPTDTSSMVPRAVAAEPTEGLRPTEMGFEFHVAPDLRPLLKPIGDFEPHPDNFRKHKLDVIMASLKEFGQQSPIVVQKSTGYICKGNGTYKVVVALGASQIAASIEDFDDHRALEYLAMDNRASDLAEYEALQMRASLSKLAEGPSMQPTLLDWHEDLQAQDDSGVRFTELGPSDADFAETPEARAERKAAAGQSGAKLKEVPVTMSVADHKVFMAEIKVLRGVYKTTGTIATIIEAVHREAARVAPTPEQIKADAKADVAAALAESGMAEDVASVSEEAAEPDEAELIAKVG